MNKFEALLRRILERHGVIVTNLIYEHTSDGVHTDFTYNYGKHQGLNDSRIIYLTELIEQQTLEL